MHHTAHLIPAVFKSQAWGVLHSLLEIIVFRVHLQLQYSYRFQLLQQLHTVASVSIIPAQLYGSTENAALRLIKGLGSHEFLIQLAKQFAADPKPVRLSYTLASVALVPAALVPAALVPAALVPTALLRLSYLHFCWILKNYCCFLL